ncbi:TorCAD operon transcriptional regulatory protein TorR [Pseudomonas reidholzensis]|uniref:TorCAD operon transcriptional regulatory protein TorR n=1 Tax=Pseudomonas reidholzensis TaxID=1785162 RepID=A0A383RSJ2_9PSED|nr:response regulator transcription factor [Pseudomonas reidholzensis]SYX90022.1 TorCAD operon transcriptional regulatory protein TorR [Pseudomonas reidholzensis]
MPATQPLPAPRVLVVDDHRKIRDPLATYLRRHGFEVRTAADAAGLWQLLKQQDFDVAVLDVMLPDGDGFELCQQLHRRCNLPVILLTARDTTADRVRGLDLGADDYLTKPFEPRELVARLNSVLRRHQATQARAKATPTEPAASPRRYRFAGWQFCASTATLSRAGREPVRLSTAEGKLLQVLLEHPHVSLSRQRLVDLTAAQDSDISERAIDRQVSRLRRKLDHDGHGAELLRTLWGSGYLLAADVDLE